MFLVDLEAIGDRLFPVIVALVKFSTAAITDAGFFRRIENHVTEGAAASAGATASQPLDNNALRHLNR